MVHFLIYELSTLFSPILFLIFAPYILLFYSQILTLEMEKSSSQQNLDNVVELATEQNICAREKFDEVSTVQYES